MEMESHALKAHEVVVEKATPADAAEIKPIVDAAFSKYTERLGMLPAAMTADYAALARTQNLYVLRVKDAVLGAILLMQEGDSIKVSNLVVHPGAHGRGYGRMLMEYAEEMARARGLPALTLFTNERMHENITLYTKTGFMETGRKTEGGFNRVYFRKQLA
jgi:ribosomal protein S18 acetylase RimI-like enzyme